MPRSPRADLFTAAAWVGQAIPTFRDLMYGEHYSTQTRLKIHRYIYVCHRYKNCVTTLHANAILL